MQIRQKIMGAMVAASVAAFLASNAAYGAVLTLSYGSAYNGTGSGPGAYGGEFLITSTDGWAAGVAANYASSAKSGNGFETFCMEYNQHISIGGSYDYQISSAARPGGMSVSDPISAGTGLLYSLFARGALTGYNNDATSAGALQQTLWFLEGERTTSGGLWDNLLIAEFGSLAAAKLDDANAVSYGMVNAAAFGVAALNMGLASQMYPNQDQLVYLGGARQAVPDGGATVMLLGAAMGGISLIRRKLA